MSNDVALIAKIVERPDDDAARQVLADFYEEEGQAERAAFIRHMLELEPIWRQPEHPRSVELHRLCRPQRAWSGIEALLEDWTTGIRLQYRRGLVDSVTLPGQALLQHGALIRQRLPTIRRVALTHVAGLGAQLSACAALAGLDEVMLACWYPPEDAQALAGSAHLATARRLVLWLGRRGDLDWETLLPFASAVSSWSNLRDVALMQLEDTAGQRWVQPFYEAAGRPLARWVSAFPERIPVAADFGFGVFPGRLRDGSDVIAVSRGELGMHTLDADGSVAHSTELPTSATVSDEALLAYLRAEHGFSSAFQWVSALGNPIDAEWDVAHDELGRIEHPYEEWPGQTCDDQLRYVRSEQYNALWGVYADWTGRVHST
ncbi:MAG: TIGR02996 domain-containing protein [Myxococcales bacterium]|nr:TIGR02996 domain-containing protein [Myxococcales bacterium]